MAHDIQIVTEAELKRAVKLDLTAVDVVEKAFAALASGKVVMPPILSMDLHDVNGEVDVKTAYIPGFDGFAIKVSPGFFNNPQLGLPSLNGLMILFSAKTGLVESLFLDNGYLTDIRTAAAGAVAARHLAPETVETAGVIGTGVQARLQMIAAHLVRPFKHVLVHGRDAEKASACAADLAAALDDLPGRKLIFTNASRGHAERVMERLGIADRFETIFDIVDAQYIPKPEQAPYDLLLARDGIDPGKAVYFEDMAKNLLPAKDMGMTTVWVHTDVEWAQAGRDDPRIDHQTDNLVGFLRTLANGS